MELRKTSGPVFSLPTKVVLIIKDVQVYIVKITQNFNHHATLNIPQIAIVLNILADWMVIHPTMHLRMYFRIIGA